MAEIPNPPDRQRRLEEIRNAVKDALASGAGVDRDYIRSKYPELSEEVEAILSDEATIVGDPVEESTRLISAPPKEDETIPATLGSVVGRGSGGEETVAEAGRDPDATAVGETLTDAMGGEHTLPLDSTTILSPGANGSDESLEPGTHIRYIGDYSLLSVLGVGGMGIVYKARQISLNRPVALKMIKSEEFASEDQLRRFQNEAEAVAKLDHPGIVPIFEVGQYEDKRYFSMKLIEGASLEKLLEEKPLEMREAARLTRDIALAIDHAHRRGILHRDLKPANILVDHAGAPHVTDFGLAKRIEGDEGLTLSGAILGTPSFMSPEQAMGRIGEITTASDVYGIGAIMYATMTGRKPFRSNSLLETLELVRHAPPQAPTEFNARVPRDLEVICLKCMEKDPRRRYESARDLADDLDRWLDGLPIKARPVGRLTRAAMWCRRNPALASLGTALAAALVIGAVGIAIQWREAIHQRGEALKSRDLAVREEAAARKAEGEAKAARDIAVAARAEAEQNALLAGAQTTQALQTLQDLIMRVRSTSDPALVDLRKEITQTALARVDKVADGYEKSTSKEATTAAALSDLASIYRELGQSEKSLKLYRRVDAIYQARLVVKNRNDASRTNLARNYRDLAQAMMEVDRDLKGALEIQKKSAALFQEILDNPRTPNPGDLSLPRPIGKLLLANAQQDIGATYLRIGDTATALEWFRKAYQIRTELATPDPKSPKSPINPDVLNDLGFSHLAMSEALFRQGDVLAAQDHLRRAIEVRSKLVELLPKDRRLLSRLGDAYYNQGWLELRRRRPEASHAGFEKALKIRTDLVASEPRNVVNQRALGMSYHNLGIEAELSKNAAAAKDYFEKTRDIRRKLSEADPENDRRKMELMLILPRVGESRKALELAREIAAKPKLDNEARYDLARCHSLVSKALVDTDKPTAAESRAKAIALLRDAVADGYADRTSLETEFDLDPIRDDAGFVELMKKLP